MAEIGESWKDVASKAEALGLKLKLHLEQEQEDGAAPEPGDTKAMVDELGQKLTDAFDSLGNAAKDPAVHSDVKDIGNTLRDALLSTFSAVGAEVNSRTKRSDGNDDGGAIQDLVDKAADMEAGSDDEDDGDS